jgi:NTE family protein
MLFVAAATLPAQNQTTPSKGATKRPKIGVAFAGGAALGFAHVGVLKWFEENHIPIDYVAGTSMGGLVGGMYATGKNYQEIHDFVEKIDWVRMFGPPTPYKDLTFRRKQDVRDYANYLEFGWRDGFRLPSGLNTGEGVSLLISSFAAPYGGVNSFDDLPTSFRCVSTDLVEGKRVVFEKGSLSEALRATMSLPGIFSPVKVGNMQLVDGALMDNLPVDVAKSMGADIVIALSLDNEDVYDPSKSSLFSVASRSISVMITENERRSLELADLVVAPDLKGFDSSDFTRAAELEQKGYEAAEAKARFLKTLALNDQDWAAYLAERKSRVRHWESPRSVVISGEGTDKGYVQKSFQALTESPSQPSDVAHTIQRFTGNGLFQAGTFDISSKNDEPVLHVNLSEKSYGPPFLNFGITIDGSRARQALFQFAGRVTFFDLGASFSEWRTDYSLGINNQLSSEYYWRLRASKWFIAPRAFAGRTEQDLYSNNNLTAQYFVAQAGAGGDIGYAYSRDTEFRFGAEWSHVNAYVAIGSPDLPSVSGNLSFLRARWAYDGTDNGQLPTHGLEGFVEAGWVLTAPELGKQYPLFNAKFLYAHPLSDKYLFITKLSGGTTVNTTTRIGTFTLGGPFQLSALGPSQLLGDNYYNTNFYLLRQFAQSPIGFLERTYFLGGFEMGSSYSSIAGTTVCTTSPVCPFNTNSSPYLDGVGGLVAVTRLGVITVGGSYGQNSQGRFFFKFGTVF